MIFVTMKIVNRTRGLGLAGLWSSGPSEYIGRGMLFKGFGSYPSIYATDWVHARQRALPTSQWRLCKQ